MSKKTPRNAEEGQPPVEGAPSFETQLAELEEIVQQLEAGEKPLEESLALYERGIAALKTCHALLDRAEQRIRKLVEGPDGKPALADANLDVGAEAPPRPAGRPRAPGARARREGEAAAASPDREAEDAGGTSEGPLFGQS